MHRAAAFCFYVYFVDKHFVQHFLPENLKCKIRILSDE